MRIKLSSLVLVPVVLAVAALATQTAVAESHVVNVPFSFVAGGHTCPAGAYAVSADNRGDTVRLISRRNSFVWLLTPGDVTVSDHRVVLTFDVSGENHTLRTVQYGASITPRINRQHESIPDGRQIALGQ